MNKIYIDSPTILFNKLCDNSKGMSNYKKSDIRVNNKKKKSMKKKRIIIYAHGKKYDVTEFVKDHPAGAKCIVKKNGQNCTIDYDFHNQSGKIKWKKYLVQNANSSICIVL